MRAKIKAIGQALTWKGKSTRHKYLHLVLLWNPAIAFIFVLARHRQSSLALSWAVSLYFTEVISSLSFGGVILLALLFRARAKARGVTVPKFSRLFSFKAALATMPFAVYLGLQAGRLLFFGLGWPWHEPKFAEVGPSMLDGILILALMSLFRIAGEATAMEQAAALNEQKSQTERLQTQLTALTNQMNPHLLFNALNTIASLVHTAPARAEETAVRLADLYRSLLNASGQTTHSLEQELAICAAYLGIEQARFGERLQTRFDVDPRLDPKTVQVPYLMIQPLVENAVRHGIAPRAKGGKITIIAGLGADDTDSWQVRVVDDGVGIGRISRRDGLGLSLQNIAERLKLAFGAKASFTIEPDPMGGTIARLIFPLDTALAFGPKPPEAAAERHQL